MPSEGCALNSDGSLKDASEMDWDFDKDTPSPSPAEASSVPSTSFHPFFAGKKAPAVTQAGSRRSTRASRPSMRITDPDNAMTMGSGSTSNLQPSTAAGKRKALGPIQDSRRVACKVVVISDSSESETENKDTPTPTPCDDSATESNNDEFDALQAMADADQVGESSLTIYLHSQ